MLGGDLLVADAALDPPGSRAATQAPALRVGLFGLFGTGNLGNDGTLEAMANFVQRAVGATPITCICGSPEGTDASLGLRLARINVRLESPWLRRLNRLLLDAPREVACSVAALRVLRSLDVLIVPGTGILDDFGTGPRGMPWWLFRWCALARLAGVRVLFVSIGAGPIHHPLSRWLMKAAARLASFRSYRDQTSRDYMRGLGFDVSADRVRPDLAFGLPAPEWKPSLPGAPLRIGVGVMSYNGWRSDRARDDDVQDAYVAKLARFVIRQLDEGRHVRLLMGEDTDERTLREIERRALEARGGWPREALVAESATSLHDVMRQMSETDVVVATRFHNVVCALKLGLPVLSIGYARKNAVLLEAMGLGAFCQSIDALDEDQLLRQFASLLRQRDALVAGVKASVARLKAELAEQELALLAELRRP